MKEAVLLSVFLFMLLFASIAVAQLSIQPIETNLEVEMNTNDNIIIIPIRPIGPSECGENGCSWCGNACGNSAADSVCPAVLPPENYACECVDGQCKAVESELVCRKDADCKWCDSECVKELPGLTCDDREGKEGYTCQCFEEFCIEAEVGKVHMPLPPGDIEVNMTVNATGYNISAEHVVMNISAELISLHTKPIYMNFSSSPQTVDISPSQISVKPVSAMPVHGAPAAGVSEPMPTAVRKVTSINIVPESAENVTVEVNAILNGNEKYFRIMNRNTVVYMTSGGVTAESAYPLEVNETGVFLRKNDKAMEIRMLPDEAAERAKEMVTKIIKMRLDFDQEPVYRVNAERSGRMLWVLPVSFSVDVEIIPLSGETIVTNSPWWDFLVF